MLWKKLSRQSAKTRLWKIVFVPILLSLAGCAGAIIVSDYCALDGLILTAPGDVKVDSFTEGEIAIHNAVYECACSEPEPKWCSE